jgi:hypothetical protein
MSKVRNLKFDGEAWYWSFEDEPKVSYFTNNNGEGIFRQKTVRETNFANECDIKQKTGICQFSLKGYSISGARKKLNRYYED